MTPVSRREGLAAETGQAVADHLIEVAIEHETELDQDR